VPQWVKSAGASSCTQLQGTVKNNFAISRAKGERQSLAEPVGCEFIFISGRGSDLP
jgi:hypothetical protein